MKEKDRISGFIVKRIEELPENHSTMYLMEHEKVGTELIWMDRDDDNKTFAAGFKTLPKDDTGVFHILEHSVLAGSRNYPTKEPFVDLLKSSLQTFLNAFTAPDSTMYPVSSRNEQDFINLVDVYLDAVFHPLCIEDPFTFRQEGWHYEVEEDENGEKVLTFNGVVFNEMKGATTSPDDVLYDELSKLIFPDNSYRYNSGGNPEAIPDLTFEEFKAQYKKHYHPSNSKIYLDGKMDVERVLSRIDRVISEFEPGTKVAEIAYQNPITSEDNRLEYEISLEEQDLDRVIVAQSWVYGKFDDVEKDIALAAIEKALAETNESPLKKALLDEGLAEEVELDVSARGFQHSLTIVAKNTSEDKIEKIYKVINRVLSEQASGKLDHSIISSALKKMEFKNREKDYGSMPRGLVHALEVWENWQYGGDPTFHLKMEKVFKSLREKLDEGFFENVIKDCILNNNHTVKLSLIPSATLGEERRAKERQRLDEIWNSWSDSEKEKVEREFIEFRERQQRDDDPEALATIPKLELKDIPKETPIIPQSVSQVKGRTLMHQNIDTNGITYLNMYFDMSDFDREELAEASFLATLVSHVPTKNYDVITLGSKIDEELGALGAYTTQYGNVQDSKDVRPYTLVSASFLSENRDVALELINEVLNNSSYENADFIYNLLHQTYMEFKQSIQMSGNLFAKRRALSYSTEYGAVDEAMHGLSLYDWIKENDDEYKSRGEELCKSLSNLAKRILSGNRLSIGITGEYDDEWVEKLIDILETKEEGPLKKADYSPIKGKNEGFIIPSDIGFAAKAIGLKEVGGEYSGISPLASRAMSYGYLWSNIRVQGGAYGASMSSTVFGDVAASTFRDPQTARSLDFINGIGSALKELAESGESLDGFIISTFSDLDPLLTPRGKGLRGEALYLSGRTPEREQETRKQLLSAKPSDLIAYGEMLEEAFAKAYICVIGGQGQIDSCQEKLDAIKTI